IMISNMDTTVSPGEDFFRFANGGWLDRAQIPADRGSWGSLYELREKTQADVLEALKTAADNPEYAEGSDQRKVADFFDIGLDSLIAERAGTRPVETLKNQIAALAGKTDIQQYFTEQRRYGGDAFFIVQIFPDLKKSDVISIYLVGAGIGLPERDYYFDKSAKSRETREKYVAHVARRSEERRVGKEGGRM